MNFTNKTQSERVQKAFLNHSVKFTEIIVETSENNDVKDFLSGLNEAYATTKKSSSLSFCN